MIDNTTVATAVSALETFSAPTQSGPKQRGIISDEVAHVFMIMFFVVMSGVISVVGVIFNVVNIIIFVRQGFKDTVNITLLGLAVSDFFSLLTLVWMSICFNPSFANLRSIPFDTQDIQYYTAGWPHVCFARITSFITAYVTFERCLCIAMPLKVKSIITTKRTIIIVVCIFLLIIGCVSPVYYAIGLGPKHHAGKNRTLIGLVYRDDGPFIENISFSIGVSVQLFTFFTVIICTAILTQRLVSKSKWRQNVTATNEKSDTISSRDKKVVKMVVLIAVIFIACFLPSAANLVSMIISDQYSIVGRYKNMFLVSWGIFNTLEATNSTVNIFVYYNMSSRFAAEFKRLFRTNKSVVE